MKKDEIIFFNWRPAIAAVDLNPGETDLSVFSPIDTPMVSDTVINDKVESMDIKDVQTNGGDECGGFVDIASTVIAQYIGRSNMSPPCIVKGETVLISPHVNGIYFWKETGINDDYRKLETFHLRIANKLTTLDPVTDSNSYGLILDSNTKIVSLYITPLLPKEIGFTLKFDAANGIGFWADTLGNSITIDSNNHLIRICNVDQTSIEANKLNVNINAPGSINLTAGTLVKIETPAMHIKSNVTVIDGVDLAINTTQSSVITAPIVGINGQLNATVGVISNVIGGGVVSAGASASPISPCTINDTSETGTGSGAPPPSLPTLPSDAAASFNQLTSMISGITTALTALGQAILAANAAHAGASTAPAAGAITSVALSEASVATVNSTITTGAIPNVKGASGALAGP